MNGCTAMFRKNGLVEDGNFDAAEVRCSAADHADAAKLGRWLAEARDVQRDYKDLPRRKGRPERLKQSDAALLALDRTDHRSHYAHTMTRAFLPSMSICQPAGEYIVVAEVLSAA